MRSKKNQERKDKKWCTMRNHLIRPVIYDSSFIFSNNTGEFVSKTNFFVYTSNKLFHPIFLFQLKLQFGLNQKLAKSEKISLEILKNL